MKRLTAKLLMIVLTLMLVLSMAGCGRNSDEFKPDLSDLPEIENVDFKEEIDCFEEDPFNVIDLKSGNKKKLDKTDVTLKFGGQCYTSDDSVATVSDKGIVTAKGKGACFILVNSDSFGPEVYKVMVDAPKEISFVNIMSVLVPVLIVVILIVIIVANRTHKPKMPNIATPQNTPPMYNGYGDNSANGTNYVNQQPASGTKICPNCGQQAAGAFCPYCGGKLN